MPSASRSPARIMQTEFGPLGNCQSACLATLLGVPLSEVPNFAAIANGDGNIFTSRQKEWLEARGYGIVTCVQWQALPWPPKPGYFICGGVSERGVRHAVIYRDGVLWHDPHPDGIGISNVDDLDIIYPLNPCRPSEMAKPDSGTVKVLTDLLDRAYKMHVQAGTLTHVSAQDGDQNDPLLAWLSDVRSVIYGKTHLNPAAAWPFPTGPERRST